ncbi:HlyD family efflux transporter periplasmic adaptor subunit [Novosphingobium sp. KCTC 2891]|uniref:HlyD family secretion protein n=1 Tax=Novosphingobium sp. KCTC 2891 TaxID=2989730 RepID=UPI0022219018|nr:HlyD family efflux transporter periplasmic adaptor subunit [Novosphingobium sp. KCTC 2891]MCW1382791.1 HlyD family efflux transporter periplasmic adaptor subunit [Novosphingobium sp. KCTC 2891]
MNVPRRPVIALAMLAAVAGAAFVLAPRDEPERWLGYVEGEALYVAAPVSGTLARRPVERGATVRAGQELFALDPRTTDAQTAQAQAELASARAQFSDLGDARQRAPELDVSRAAQQAARAQLARAQADYDRFAALAAKGFASRTQLDAARQARDVAAASVRQAQAQEASGELTVGRREQQAAAAAGVAGAQAALSAQVRRGEEIAPVAAVAGTIEQTFFNPGEWVPANQPVLALLPADRRKLRFFVPQDSIAALKPGMAVRFTCDGCGAARTATIRYIAPRAEFTPPVIYSERARAKLVFLVEAALPVDQPLPPGLPVAIEPR